MREGGREDHRGRDVPANMISLSFPFPVFTKNSLSFPSTTLVTLLVKAKPEPPWALTVVFEASKERAFRIAGSSFVAIV